MSYIPLLSCRHYISRPNLSIISKLKPKWFWKSPYFKIEHCETKSIYTISNTKKSLSNIDLNGYSLQFKSLFKKKKKTIIKMCFDKTLFCWYVNKKPFRCYFIIKHNDNNILFTSKMSRDVINIIDNKNNILLTFFKNNFKPYEVRSLIHPHHLSWLSKDIILICHFIFNIIIILFIPQFFER